MKIMDTLFSDVGVLLGVEGRGVGGHNIELNIWMKKKEKGRLLLFVSSITVS